MANLVLDFLHKAENFGEGAVQSVANPAAKLGNEVGAFGQLLTGNQQGAASTLNPGGGLLHQGGILQGQELNGQSLSTSDVGKIVGTGAEIASNAVGGGAAKDVAESAVKNGTSKLTLDFIHGAQGGAVAAGLNAAGNELANGQSINPKAIAENTVIGGATGGLIGAGVPAVGAAIINRTPLNEGGYLGGSNAKSFNDQVLDNKTFAGNDNQPRFEADDSQAIVTPPDQAFKDLSSKGQIQDGESLKLNEVLNHPTLFNDYPQLSDVNVQTMSPSDNKLLGGYSAKTNTIYLNKSVTDNPQLLKQTIMHETQHAIQNVEGFPGGTSMAQVGDRSTYNQNPGEQEASMVGNKAISPAKNLLTDNQLLKLSQSNDPNEIEKELGPVTGPVVAQKIAPAVALSTDAHGISNIVDNSVNQHVAPAVSSENVQSPAPVSPIASLPPVTDTSDVNTPQQVAGQASAEEQSLLNSQPEPSFMAGPGEEPTGEPSHVSKAGVMQGMQDILNKGGTSDEALNHYFENVPARAPGEAQQALDQVINSAGVDKSKINAKLNPQYQNVDFPQATTKDAAVLNGQYANNKVVQAGQPALDSMQNLDEHDMELTRHLKGQDAALVINQAHDPEAFGKTAQALKQYNDYTQAAGAQLGQDIPYRQNYGLRTPYNPPEEAQGQVGDAKNPENASYTNQRIYNTHEEALANGEVPKNATAIEDLQNDISQRAHDQSQLALAKGLEQAYPGQVKIINDGKIPNGYHQLLIPNGDKIFMPTDIANEINTRQMAGQSTGALGKNDQINAAGKNLELGGGLFHGFNTGGIFAGQQLASGKLFSNPSATANVVKNLLSDNATKDYMSELGKEGTFDDNHSVINAADAAGLNYSNASSDIGKPGDKGLVGKIASIPGLKQIHQSIFERQIPTMMMETFRQKTQGLDVFGNAADREQAIKIAKGINQEYGHLNRDIQGLTPKQFKLASRVMLAADYQEGQIKTLAAAFNPKNFGTAEGRLAREAVFGKALVFGGLATLGGAAGGDFKGDNAKQTALAIMNKAINPSFDVAGYKVGLPATQISNVAKPVEESIASAKKGEGIAAGPEDFASSHAAFLPSKAEEFGTNKNFEGNPIYGKDYFGRPISGASVAENALSGIAPIPLAQTAQTATGNQSVGAAIANTVGLNASPQYNLNYAPVAGQTYVQELQDTPGVPKAKVQAATQFFDLLGQGSKNKSKTIDAAEKAIIAKNPQKADQIINNYNQQLIKTLMPWAKSGGTNYLDPTMLQLLQTAEVTYKKANENVSYDVKTNPTAYGVPIQALQTANQGG
jgi:hypothetical protein